MVAPFAYADCWDVAALDTAGVIVPIIGPTAALRQGNATAGVQANEPKKTTATAAPARTVFGPWCVPSRVAGVFGAGLRGLSWPCPTRVD